MISQSELIKAMGSVEHFFISSEMMKDMPIQVIFRACGWHKDLLQPIDRDLMIDITRGRPCYIRLKPIVRFGHNVFVDKPKDILHLSHYKTGAYILTEEFEPKAVFKDTNVMLLQMPGFLRSYFP